MKCQSLISEEKTLRKKIKMPSAENFTQSAKRQVDCRKCSVCNSPDRMVTLRKHAYSNILIILPPKTENFQIKNSDILLISAQNIDCGYSLEPPRRGGSNKYHNLCF